MKKIILFSVLILFICSACSGNRKENKRENKVTLETDSKEENVVLPSDSGIIRINLSNGEGNLKIQKKENQTIYIEFKSEGYKKLAATLLSSDSLSNIRFSQIFLPDGSMDGPFGRNMEYQLPIDGIYKLSVHENMMADDPWSGIFIAHIKLIK